MANKRKQLIRVVFDVVDENKQQIRSNEARSVAALDPDEAIEWVYAEMQRQFNRSDIRLSRVSICA